MSENRLKACPVCGAYYQIGAISQRVELKGICEAEALGLFDEACPPLESRTTAALTPTPRTRAEEWLKAEAEERERAAFEAARECHMGRGVTQHWEYETFEDYKKSQDPK